MKKCLLLCLLLIPALANAQGEDYYSYIIDDTDGYLNIREKPTANSRIVGRIEKYELFFDARYFCFNDTLQFKHYPPNWIPVCKDMGPMVGYVYKPNALPLEMLPVLVGEKDGNRLVCGNDKFRIILSLSDFDPKGHKIEDYHTVDGVFKKGFYGDKDGYSNKEISSLTLYQDGKKKSLPIDHIKDYFNPGMAVYIGPAGELYIQISCGDGGEVYMICLSVVNGVIRYAKANEAC